MPSPARAVDLGTPPPMSSSGNPTGDALAESERFRLAYRGRGGDLARQLGLPFLVSVLTLGLFSPYAFTVGNQVIYREAFLVTDTMEYRFEYSGTSERVAMILFPSLLLCAVSLGLYFPFFITKLQRYVVEHSKIVDESGALRGRLGFTGTPSELARHMLAVALLSVVTLGVYGPWGHIRISKYMASCTPIHVDGTTLSGRFQGLGVELAAISLKGAILTFMTFGLYSFWWMARMLEFQLGHTDYSLESKMAPSGN